MTRKYTSGELFGAGIPSDITKIITKGRKDQDTFKKGLKIQAEIQAKVWRGQMKGRFKDTIVKDLLKRLRTKYPKISSSEIEHIAIKVI